MVRVSDSETMIGMLNIKSRDGQTMCASIELQRSRKKAGKTVDLQRARVWHVSQSCDGMLGESLRARKGEGARTSGRRWCLTAVDQHEVGRVAAHEAAEERRLDVGDEGGGADDHATHGHQRVAEIDAYNQAANVLSVAATKAMIYETVGLKPEAAMAVALERFKPVFESNDAVEGMRAFREKRLPVWTGK